MQQTLCDRCGDVIKKQPAGPAYFAVGSVPIAHAFNALAYGSRQADTPGAWEHLAEVCQHCAEAIKRYMAEAPPRPSRRSA